MRRGWSCIKVAALATSLLAALPDIARADPLCTPFATGGTISLVTSGNEQFCVHQFTDSGVFSPQQSLSVEYLIVGGGGGGGSSDLFEGTNWHSGGGGGAGGVRQGGGMGLSIGIFSVLTGGGGAGGTSLGTARGVNGGDSSFNGLVAAGGGGGGGSTNTPAVIAPTAGGSGGGGGGRQSWNDQAATNGAAGVAGQGNSGGDGRNGSTGGTRGANAPEQTGGGGGGAGGAGGAGLSNQGGTGGGGITSEITGTVQGYAGGGGGGHRGNIGSGGSATHGGGTGAGGTSTAPAGNGQPGTGGGGGGAGRGQDQGGNGGSGIVVIRYLVNTRPSTDAGQAQSVTAFSTVTLDGTGTTDPDGPSPTGNITSYSWTQISGTSVFMSGATTETASFTAPQPTGSSEVLTFRLTVTDAFGLTDTSDVTITVTALPGQPAPGTGGTVNEYNDLAAHVTWRVHRFFENGTLTLPHPTDVGYLIVGGGGGGGAAAGGGGGGGGVRTGTATALSGDQTITVGTGGAGGIGSFPDSAQQSRGSNGEDSVAFGVIALGGGGGGTYFSNTTPAAWGGLAGGSGGGASHTGPGGAAGGNEQGNPGATGEIGCGSSSGGGGGGAGQSGSVGTSMQGGKGGDGTLSNITGVSQYYAGGGAGGGDDRITGCLYTGIPGVVPNVGGLGGGGASTATHGEAGTDGLGGGGGGAQLNTATYSGGRGGSGIVAARYIINTGPTANAGPDATAAALQKFTLDGTGTTDPDGNITSIVWTQTSGTSIDLEDGDTLEPSFTPAQPAGGATSETLTFDLTVTDAFGLTSTDTVTITLEGVAILTASKQVSVFSENADDCGNLDAEPPAEPENPAAIPGACIQYVISVENTGTVAAHNITLVDELPGHLNFEAAGLSPLDWGIVTSPGCLGADCEVRVEQGVIPADSTATLTIRATIN